VRGAKHTGNSVEGGGSQGSAIKPDLWYKGNSGGWTILKETVHFGEWKGSNNKTCRVKEKFTNKNILESNNQGDLTGKWFGIKTVVYNGPKKTFEGKDYWPVVIETYVCKCDDNGNPDNDWKVGIRAKDDPEQFGPWSDLPDEQPGDKTHTISWGGPIITCRTDSESGTGGGYPGMKFKKVSIREIDPGSKF
jgi:hypothetical protein